MDIVKMVLDSLQNANGMVLRKEKVADCINMSAM